MVILVVWWSPDADDPIGWVSQLTGGSNSEKKNI